MAFSPSTLSPKAAGRLLVSNVPTVGLRATIGQVEKQLSQNVNTYDWINEIYVVGKDEKLHGIVSIKDIFDKPASTPVSKVMHPPVETVRLHTPQERVAFLALKHNLSSVPVLDTKDRFVGIIPAPTILATLHQEHVEDLLAMAGIQGHHNATDHVMDMPILRSVKHRLPWLLLGLLGGLFVERIIALFSHTLEENLLLAGFIPVIVYMGSAVGTQMEAFAIRDLSIQRGIVFSTYFLRQLSIVVLMGLISSTLLFGMSYWIHEDLTVSLVLSFSLLAAIISSVATGLLFPYLFSRMDLDPANASGPIATIVQDLMSVVIYLEIATYLL